jgi:hypothetical protein
MTKPRQDRWDPYYLVSDARWDDFWQKHLASDKRRVLYLLGKGFDPRMGLSAGRIFARRGSSEIEFLLLEFDEGEESPSRRYEDQVARNYDAFVAATKGSKHTVRSIQIWHTEGSRRRRIGGTQAVKIFQDPKQLLEASDIIVDISAIPRSIYYPLLGRILTAIDAARKGEDASLPNLFIVTAEDTQTDASIRHTDPDDQADYIPYFTGGLDIESNEDLQTVWIPILGEGQDEKLRRIYDKSSPDEICPMVPFPSAGPRRGDQLLEEYRPLLFREWGTEPTNIIFGDERNPFQAYREIMTTVHHYQETLQPLGGCQFVLSAISSKLLSIAGFLAAYELRDLGIRCGVVHVDSRGYEIIEPTEPSPPPKLFALWISGEPYDFQR